MCRQISFTSLLINLLGWEHSLAVQCFPSMCQAVGSVLSIEIKIKRKLY